VSIEDEIVEYDIDLKNLPEGQRALWNINALRDIRLGSDFPDELAHKIKSMTLCVGKKALDYTVTTYFNIFQKQDILPLFVIHDQKITVRICFKELSENDRFKIPRKTMKAEGLLVKIKEKTVPFFVAASEYAILTWDGEKHHIFSKAAASSLDDESEEDEQRIYQKKAAWSVVHDDNTNFNDLWSASN
jgi:hypothetical protein